MRTTLVCLCCTTLALGCARSDSDKVATEIVDSHLEVVRKVVRLQEELQEVRAERDELRALVKRSLDLDSPPAEFGTGPLWGDVLPERQPFLLGEYDATLDVGKLRSTHEGRAYKVTESVRIDGNIDIGLMQVGYKKWAADLKVGKRSDYLEFWSRATEYTNYINNLDLTESEAREFADRARQEVPQKVAELLQKWVEGENFTDPTKFIELYCYKLRLTEEDIGLTRAQILEKIETGKKPARK